MKKIYLLLLPVLANHAFAQSFTNTFDTSPALGGNDPGGNAASGQWYVDRYAPATFASASFLGDNRLDVGVNASDYSSNTGNSTFYDWQGRKYYLNNAIVGSSVSAQLYIPTAWTGINVSPSMWLTAYDSSGSPADYPIVSFYSSGSGSDYFRVWDESSGWVNLATPINWNDWNTLTITFTIAGFVYNINGTDVYTESAGIDAGAVSIANVMFESHNYGTSYDAYWDNLIVTVPGDSTLPVPEPTVFSLLVGSGALVWGMRKFFRQADVS